MGWVGTYLLIKPLDPPIEVFELFAVQILALIQRPVEIFGQHLFVEALACETAGGVSAGEVLVGPAGAVEIAAGGYVVDFACGVGKGGLVGWSVVVGGFGGEGGGEWVLVGLLPFTAKYTLPLELLFDWVPL